MVDTVSVRSADVGNRKRRCVVFDLDGTLCNTLPDIVLSVNNARAHFRLPPLADEVVRGFIGNGIQKLAERSFRGSGVDTEEAAKIMTMLYAKYPVVKTTPYPGVVESLAFLKKNDFGLAVVTNKPKNVVLRIFDRLDLTDFFFRIVGGGEGMPLKPDPAGILSCVEAYGADCGSSWVFGDNYTDIEAGSNAGMTTAFASYGYGVPSNKVRADFTAAAFGDFALHVVSPAKFKPGAEVLSSSVASSRSQSEK